MALSEIIRFTLPTLSTPKFVKLREHVSRNCGVKNQYFGRMVAPSQASLPIRQNEMCWVIQWPQASDIHLNESFRNQLSELVQGEEAKSLLFQFEDAQISELAKALEAPVCEFAIINLSPLAPLLDPDFKHSMHKTYTDCYRMRGFTGGNWAHAMNTNDTNGILIESGKHPLVQENERRLACYYLGWESVELHEAASATSIFAEEMDKLMPWFGQGTGAWYVTFKKHL